ncbi:phage major tail tube protein [Aquabacterium sp.]|uniref:phage major tail tube protein n=1 Tax=Aquabacterium sp. TaxID=1872578 RepID=UPI003BB0E18F
MSNTARHVRKNFNLFLDGRGYAGQVEDFTPPKLALKLEEARLGGMDAPVKLDMGSEGMQASFTMLSAAADVIALWGVTDGTSTRITLREALESFDGEVTPYVHTLAGRITEVEHDPAKSGDKASVKFVFEATYYRLEHGARKLHEIDVVNMIRVVNGVDVLKAKRDALGI